jgi:hypothetical protein
MEMRETSERFGKTRVFHAADYAVPLSVPDGARFAEPKAKNNIKPALQAGLVVFVLSCDGRAFVWREGERYVADLFFLAPARHLEFSTVEEATEFASGLCE